MEGVLWKVSSVHRLVRELADSISALPQASDFEASQIALNHLLECLTSDFDLPETRRRKRNLGNDVRHELAKARRNLSKQRNKVDDLKGQLQDERIAKISGRIKDQWLIRVGTAAPTTPLRTLAQWCRDFPLDETKNISHVYVSHVKDAYVEAIKTINEATVCAQVASAGAAQVGEETKPVFVVHIQDEAAMKVKSYVHSAAHSSGLQTSGRGKTSKIQNHVVTIHTADSATEFFTELQALQRKDGRTIATCLIQIAKKAFEVISQGMESIGGHCRTSRIVHIVVGDAINTNDNACRRMFRFFQDLSPQIRMRYALVVIRCASHQSNLVVAVAICGRQMANVLENNQICGTCSRLFKYLIPEYLEEFASNLRAHVLKLRFCHVFDQTVLTAKQQESAKIRELYGDGVLPPSLLQWLNGSVTEFEHFCEEGVDKELVCGQLYQLLYRFVLRLESKPVVTRFWLFAECVWCLLLIDILGFPSSIFTLSTVSARKLNVKRLRLVQQFFAQANMPADLRRAALCLQLTQHAVSMSSQSKPQEGKLPLFVRLAQGEVQQHTCEHMQKLIRLLHVDPKLDVVDTMQGLLTTEIHIIIRFEVYSRYPGKLWEMCRKYNPLGHLLAIQAFLEEPEEELDYGYAHQLQVRALAEGSISDAATYLMSSPVQAEIAELLNRILAHSLDVERKHNQDKASEMCKASSVARASRNSILLRYRVQREQHMGEALALARRAGKDKFMNLIAVARQRRPDLFPQARGKLWWEKGVTQTEMQRLRQPGDPDALEAFLAANREAFAAEAEQIRSQARILLQKKTEGLMPFRNREWLLWLEKNREHFNELLKKAPLHRRAFNHRVVPDAALPVVSRMQARPEATGDCQWEAKLLQVQPCFAYLKWGDGPDDNLVVFVAAVRRQCRYVICQKPDLGQNLYVPVFACRYSDVFLTRPAMVAKYSMTHVSANVEVSQIWVRDATCAPHDVALTIVRQSLVELQPNQRGTSKRAADDTESTGDDDFAMPDSEAESVLSDAEDSAEDIAEEGEHDVNPDDGVADDADDEDVCVDLPSHVVFNNGYFAASQDPELPFCVMRIQPKWTFPASEGGLGIKFNSKTATLAHYGDVGAPTRTLLLLRAWMIYRFQQHGFADAKPERRQWLAREVSNLRRDIQNLNVLGGGTGDALADRRIRTWALYVLG